MKRLFILCLTIVLGCFTAKAQLSSSEYSQLTSSQKADYDRMSAAYRADLKAAQDDLYKAEDIIKMGNEMKGDNARAAGAAHIARGVALKEKALKAIEEAKKNQRLLDQAAREAIKKNKKE